LITGIYGKRALKKVKVVNVRVRMTKSEKEEGDIDS